MTDVPFDNGDKTASRDEGGRFRAGSPGGPGRPAGLRNRVTVLLEKVLAADAVAVTKALIARAKDGDVQAGKAILDRLLPIARSRPITLGLPEVKSLGDVLAAQQVVIEAMGAG